MKKLIPIEKATSFASGQSIKLTKKTLENAEKANSFLMKVGNLTMFFAQTVRETFSGGFELKEFLRQCYQLGNKSFSLIALSGFIMGIVLTIQSRPALAEFGAESWLPGMVAISIIREIGPMITALICAGKIGSGIGAEIGSMKVTEQIDAMEVSSTNPVKYLFVTRILAATIMLPVLVIFADGFGFFGSWAGVNIKGNVNLVLFISQAFGSIDFMDFFPAPHKNLHIRCCNRDYRLL